MATHIATWFHTEDTNLGEYAAVRGDVSSEKFRDVYRRCLVTFYVMARRECPDARLTLFVNRPWDESGSRTAGRASTLLWELGVETVLVDFATQPPPTFTPVWRNQLYLFDLLPAFARRVDDDDVCVLLDGDIAWGPRASVNSLFEHIARAGTSCMPLGLRRDEAINGLSELDLEDIARRSPGALPAGGKVTYCGGEYIAATGKMLATFAESCRAQYLSMLEMHGRDRNLRFEDGHVMSIVHARLGSKSVPPDVGPKQIWTQVLHFRNVTVNDPARALWHVPAEKRYGLRRLYDDVADRGVGWVLNMDENAWQAHLQRRLGVPRNTTSKAVRDVARAILERVSR